jgi:uroporphyrinogen decarboxylase
MPSIVDTVLNPSPAIKTHPIWFMRQAGRYLPEYRALRQSSASFLDFCFNPELSVTATLQPIERFGFDAAIIFSDILVIPYALGQHVTFVAGEGPKLGGVSHPDDFRKLATKLDRERLVTVYSALRAVRAALPAETGLIGFCGMPWTLLLYMCEGGSPGDAVKTRRWCYQEPERMRALLSLLENAVIEHALLQLEAGADTIQLFDSWAGLCPALLLEDYVIGCCARISRAVKERYPAARIIAFPRGIGMGLTAILALDDVDAVSLDTSTPLHQVVPLLPLGRALQGNLDPQALVVGGKVLTDAVAAILESSKTIPHIFNLGHGIVPETPIEHVTAVIEQVRAFKES